jgi:hypothetical protein
MADSVDIFLGEIKCKLQLFHPKPGDVFVLTIPGEISFEEEKQMRAVLARQFPETRMLVVVGATTIDIQEAN